MAEPVYERYEYLSTYTFTAVFCSVILTLASVFGTIGNCFVLTVCAFRKKEFKRDIIFIANLAMSDLYVTLIAHPMSIVAKIEGENFFDQYPGLCQTVASFCTVSCASSMITITFMSANRYFYICANNQHERIFNKRNCIYMCIFCYVAGGILVLLNVADIGDHGFDRKILECIWDRMASYPYTLVFSLTLVWIPSIITGLCYLKICLYVINHRRRVSEQNDTGGYGNSVLFVRNFHLVKTLFIIYAVFITCWIPYALLIILDTENTFPHEIHVYISLLSHLHPSLNWLIYYITNKKFANAYKAACVNICRVTEPESASTIEVGNTNTEWANYNGGYSNDCPSTQPSLALDQSNVISNELETNHTDNEYTF